MTTPASGPWRLWAAGLFAGVLVLTAPAPARAQIAGNPVDVAVVAAINDVVGFLNQAELQGGEPPIEVLDRALQDLLNLL